MGLILDTNFVITIERDTRRGVKGRAHAFFAALAARGSVKKGLALLDKLDAAFAAKEKYRAK